MSYAEALRRLGLRPSGGNHRLFRRYVDEIWAISTAHFDPSHGRRRETRRRAAGLEDVLVEHSSFSRYGVKRRLFDAGIKSRQCELCGLGEVWRGRHMSLILDHINGVPDDNRLENLRIVCPNCAATLRYALRPQEPASDGRACLRRLRSGVHTRLRASALLLDCSVDADMTTGAEVPGRRFER